MSVPLIHIGLYTIKIVFIPSMRQLKDDSANLLACEIFFLDERLYLSAFIDHVQNKKLGASQAVVPTAFLPSCVLLSSFYFLSD